MQQFKDMSGQKFGRLTVEKYANSDESGNARWLCKCECGNTHIVERKKLLRGNTKSCGCLNKDNLKLGNNRRRHGMAGTKEYRSWSKLKSRCFNEKDAKYPIYGSRGISVCDRWQVSFENFYADMGPAPTHAHSIDRIDVNGDYRPDNCRWATAKEQARNRTTALMIEYRGEIRSLVEWAEIVGIHWSTLRTRIKELNWPIEKAFNTTVLRAGI